jgi:hypothetical protein
MTIKSINVTTGEVTERAPTAAELAAAQARQEAELAKRVGYVKAEAARRLSATDWYVVRAMEQHGKQVPKEIEAHRAAIRAASDALEAMKPVPADYPADKYWP